MKRLKTKFEDVFVTPAGYYYYRGTPPGEKNTVEISLKTKDEKQVKANRAAVLKEIEQVGMSARLKIVEPLLLEFLAVKEKKRDAGKLRPRYYETVRGIVNRFLVPYFGKMKVGDIRPSEWEKFCEKFGHRDYQNHRKVLTNFLGWCVKREHLKIVPKFELPEWDKRRRMILSKDEIVRLITKGEGDLLLYVSMYLFMGIRNSEIIFLPWADVDLGRAALTITETINKNKERRELPINPFVLRLLLEKKASTESAYVFPYAGRGRIKEDRPRGRGTFSRAWHRLRAAADIPRHLTPHDLRATWEKYSAKNASFTDTQRKKMGGASMDVQNRLYISMDADDLRGLERAVEFEELGAVIDAKVIASNSK